MRDTASVGRVIGMAIALSILPVAAGCRPSSLPETDTSTPTSKTSPEAKVPVQDSETSEPEISSDLPKQPLPSQSETALPTLPTTPIESLPSTDLPKTIALNSPSSSSQDIDNVLTKGTFISGEQLTQGSLVIMDDEGIPVIELSHDFQTVSSPDLVLMLHQAKNPLIENQSSGAPSKSEDAVEIAPLKSTQGQQYYSIPAAIILDHYNSISIWCQESSTTFVVATFQWNQ